MISESLKAQVEALNPKQRRYLMAVLSSLREKEMRDYQKSLTEKIDDNNPDHWWTLDELDAILNELPDD